jgi:hypothetical protein
MTDRTAHERMARLRERRHAAGLTEVLVWVPPDRAGEIRQIAATMREEAQQQEQQA